MELELGKGCSESTFPMRLEEDKAWLLDEQTVRAPQTVHENSARHLGCDQFPELFKPF